jgi:hypothetical protein
MRRYEFLCEKCQKSFGQTMTISEHEKGKVPQQSTFPRARLRPLWPTDAVPPTRAPEAGNHRRRAPLATPCF